jgi:small-conductance mechanosensitive channel
LAYRSAYDCLLLLTELHGALRRRGSFLAGPVHVVRNYLLPLGALLILLVGAMQISGEATPVRVVATVFGFVVLVLLLSGTNATLFQGAPEGTWRKRIPAIFLDVVRFALIAVGVGLILLTSGAPISAGCSPHGLSSIVLGLTSAEFRRATISGLCPFEQPFQLGDWIETLTAKGRVVEVNWRYTYQHPAVGCCHAGPVLAAAPSPLRPPGAHSPM